MDEPGSRRERGTYHHGNLREALVAAALRLIATRGPAGFSFADVARDAGVSPAAPYRHFRDRNALCAEIARRGFDMLAADLGAAWNDGQPHPVAAIEACGTAYMGFARREPASYAIMFEAGLSRDADPALTTAHDRAFAVVRRAADAACGPRTHAGRPPPLMVALHVWALAHGIASLYVGRGDAARQKLPMTPEDLLEAALLIYLHSLGLEA